jgi:hypothetical protein
MLEWVKAQIENKHFGCVLFSFPKLEAINQ